MANEKNLRPAEYKLSVEEAKRGGIASGKARREKRTMREMLKMCLDMTDKKGRTFQELATLGLIQGAIKGKALNYRTILEALGELGPENNTGRDNGVLNELVEALKDVKKD